MHLAKAGNGYTVNQRYRPLELVEPRLKAMKNANNYLPIILFRVLFKSAVGN